MSAVRRLRHLVRKEFLQVLRDPLLRAQLLLIPLVQMVVVTGAATFAVRELPVAVVDDDRSEASRTLARRIDLSEAFRVVGGGDSGAAAEAGLVSGRVAAVVHVPDGFQEDLRRGSGPDVLVVLDGTRGATAGVAAGYLTRIVSGSAEPTAGARSRRRVELRTRAWFNPTGDYDDYMAPGILVVLVTLVGTLMTALNIAREKERGTIEQLNVTPLTRGEFIAGKLIPFWILALIELAVGLVVARLVFAVPMEGSLFLVFAFGALYLLSALGLGLLISSVSATQQQAQFIAFFVLVLYLFLSGLFTPVESMPGWARVLADGNPLKHFVIVTRAVLLEGAGLRDLLRELVFLSGFAAVLLPLSVALYSKRTR